VISMDKHPLLISVVVCTYDRPSVLDRAVRSLVAQTLDVSRYEVIVVDNGSPAATQAVVRRLQEENPRVRLVLIEEPRQGLSYARNAGTHLACGRYVAFLDDDAEAPPEWLQTIAETIEAYHERPTAIGGPIVPLYEAPKPAWFKDEYETRTHGPTERLLHRGETFSGSNMVFDKCALERSGGFAVHLGMRGNQLSVGEETDLQWRMQHDSEHATVFLYSPAIWVRHSVPASKMTVSYRLSRTMVAGHVAALAASPSVVAVARASASLIVGAASVGWDCVLRRSRYACFENWAVEALGPLAGKTGWLVGCLRLPLRVQR